MGMHVTIYTESVMRIGSGIQKLIGGGRFTAMQHGDNISLLSFI
jgi:hypothetical protein